MRTETSVEHFQGMDVGTVSVYDLKKELKTQTPIDSPRKHRISSGRKESPSKVMPLGDNRSLEIVNDSSNDAFTYLCTHPALQPKSEELAKSPCEESKGVSEEKEKAASEEKEKAASEEKERTASEEKEKAASEEKEKAASEEKETKTVPKSEKTSEKRSKASSAEVSKSRKRARSSVKQEYDDTTSGFDRRPR